MKRDILIQAIYNSKFCPDYKCEKAFMTGCCMECAEKQLAEYEKQIRANAIDDYSNKLWQVIDTATINCKLDITIEDLRNIEIIIKGLAKEMKGD